MMATFQKLSSSGREKLVDKDVSYRLLLIDRVSALTEMSEMLLLTRFFLLFSSQPNRSQIDSHPYRGLHGHLYTHRRRVDPRFAISVAHTLKPGD